jgi:hypothetical protein
MTEQEQNILVDRLSNRLSEYVQTCDVDALADLGALCFGETDEDVQIVRKLTENGIDKYT